MGKFTELKHKRYHIVRDSWVHDVIITCNVIPEKPHSLVGKDLVTIYINTDTHNALLALDPDEVDGLIFELSRLRRFRDDELYAVR